MILEISSNRRAEIKNRVLSILKNTDSLAYLLKLEILLEE